MITMTVLEAHRRRTGVHSAVEQTSNRLDGSYVTGLCILVQQKAFLRRKRRGRMVA